MRADALLARLAVPRITGSPTLHELRGVVAHELKACGFRVQGHAFGTTPARLHGVSVLGAGTGWLALLLAPLLVVPVPDWSVVLVGVGGALVVATVAVGVAAGYLANPGPSVEGVNLEARKLEEPRVWLVAHLDSKGQRYSLAGRVLWLGTWAAGAAALGVCLVLRASGPLPITPVLVSIIPALVGGAALSRSGPRNDSPGAVDNATGVIAALAAAEVLRGRQDIGVLVTDAEEFGMVGARVWGRAEGRSGVFVNFDGIDGRGRFRVMAHPSRGRAAPASLVSLEAATVSTLVERGFRVARGPLPPGVLVDGAVLARCGMAGITLSRGDLATLRVVHTGRDTAVRVDVRAALEAGRAVAAAITRCVDGAQPVP